MDSIEEFAPRFIDVGNGQGVEVSCRLRPGFYGDSPQALSVVNHNLELLRGSTRPSRLGLIESFEQRGSTLIVTSGSTPSQWTLPSLNVGLKPPAIIVLNVGNPLDNRVITQIIIDEFTHDAIFGLTGNPFADPLYGPGYNNENYYYKAQARDMTSANLNRGLQNQFLEIQRNRFNRFVTDAVEGRNFYGNEVLRRVGFSKGQLANLEVHHLLYDAEKAFNNYGIEAETDVFAKFAKKNGIPVGKFTELGRLVQINRNAHIGFDLQTVETFNKYGPILSQKIMPAASNAYSDVLDSLGVRRFTDRLFGYPDRLPPGLARPSYPLPTWKGEVQVPGLLNTTQNYGQTQTFGSRIGNGTQPIYYTSGVIGGQRTLRVCLQYGYCGS